MAEGASPGGGVDLALLAAAGREATPIMLLPVAVFGIAGAWRALAPGMFGWDFAGDALLDSIRASGPVAAGLAAWLTIRSERSGLGRLERLSRRSAAAGPLTRLGVAASAALAGYALTAGAVAAWIGVHGAVAGSLQAAEVAAGAAALLVHVTAGFLIALLCCACCCPARLPRVRRLPGRPPVPADLIRAASGAVAAIALPTAVLAATWALDTCAGARRSDGTAWPGLLVSPDVHHSPFTEWRPGFFVAVLTWFCGVAAAAILASGWALTRAHRYAIGFTAASVMAGVGLGHLHADAAHPMTPVYASVVCRSWPLVVCVNPAFAAALPQLESAFTEVAAGVSGTPAAVRSVTQLPPGASVSGRQGGYGFHLDDLRQGYALRAKSDLTRQVTWALNRPTLNRPTLNRATSTGRARTRRPTTWRPTTRRPTTRRPTTRRPTTRRY